MPSIDQNRQMWGVDHDWSKAGDEWSASWGASARDQWFGTLLPRIHPFLPAPAILEIAPGMGRWTQFLLEHCDRLIGVDITPACIDACKERFAGVTKAAFFVNDGRSLAMVEDRSVDLAFSFDSLVHVEADVIAAYLGELERTLTADGVGFLHHSNYGSYRRSVRYIRPLQPALRALPAPLQRPFRIAGLLDVSHFRATSVSAELFVDLCHASGLRCIGQEMITWSSGLRLLDCMSAVTRPGSKWDRPLRVTKNRAFMLEARSIRRYAPVFGPH